MKARCFIPIIAVATSLQAAQPERPPPPRSRSTPCWPRAGRNTRSSPTRWWMTPPSSAAPISPSWAASRLMDEAKAFHACQAPDKRSKLIDCLLASDGYVQHSFNYWADVLRAQSQGVGGSTTAQNYLNFHPRIPAREQAVGPDGPRTGLQRGHLLRHRCHRLLHARPRHAARQSCPTPRASSSARAWSARSATTIPSTSGRRSSSSRWRPSRTT
jgi:hypothetical protein